MNYSKDILDFLQKGGVIQKIPTAKSNLKFAQSVVESIRVKNSNWGGRYRMNNDVKFNGTTTDKRVA